MVTCGLQFCNFTVFWFNVLVAVPLYLYLYLHLPHSCRRFFVLQRFNSLCNLQGFCVSIPIERNLPENSVLVFLMVRYLVGQSVSLMLSSIRAEPELWMFVCTVQEHIVVLTTEILC